MRKVEKGKVMDRCFLKRQAITDERSVEERAASVVAAAISSA